MAAFDPSLLSSPGAQALSEFVTDLASEWTARAITRDEVSLVFGTVHRIVVMALPQVATAWNAKHDLVRRLPPELQEQCFSPLSVGEKCRLSLVCSHWHSIIARLPGIWSRLDISGWKRELDDLMARSGQLPLELDVSARWDMIKVDDYLRAHAHRLISLKLTLRTPGERGAAMLHYPLPLLKELFIKNYLGNAFKLSHLSEKHIPNLQTISVSSVELPIGRVVFGRITTLTIVSPPSSLDCLHQTFPALKHLRLERCSGMDLPNLPANAPLCTLEIYDCFFPDDPLVKQGYARLDQVTHWSNRASLIVTALKLFPEYPSALHARGDHGASLILTPGGNRTLRFVWSGGWTMLQRMLCGDGPSFGRLSRLVLPASYRLETLDEPPKVLNAGYVADLPALRTLAVECCTRRPSVPLFDCVQGTIRAPALSRVEIITVADALDIEHVDAAQLAAFVRNTLVCDDRGSLELVVDTAHGAQLDGDVAALRASVGKLIV